MISLVDRTAKQLNTEPTALLELWQRCLDEVCPDNKIDSLSYSRAARLFIGQTGVQMTVADAKACDVANATTTPTTGL